MCGITINSLTMLPDCRQNKQCSRFNETFNKPISRTCPKYWNPPVRWTPSFAAGSVIGPVPKLLTIPSAREDSGYIRSGIRNHRYSIVYRCRIQIIWSNTGLRKRRRTCTSGKTERSRSGVIVAESDRLEIVQDRLDRENVKVDSTTYQARWMRPKLWPVISLIHIETLVSNSPLVNVDSGWLHARSVGLGRRSSPQIHG